MNNQQKRLEWQRNWYEKNREHWNEYQRQKKKEYKERDRARLEAMQKEIEILTSLVKKYAGEVQEDEKPERTSSNA